MLVCVFSLNELQIADRFVGHREYVIGDLVRQMNGWWAVSDCHKYSETPDYENHYPIQMLF